YSKKIRAPKGAPTLFTKRTDVNQSSQKYDPPPRFRDLSTSRLCVGRQASDAPYTYSQSILGAVSADGLWCLSITMSETNTFKRLSSTSAVWLSGDSNSIVPSRVNTRTQLDFPGLSSKRSLAMIGIHWSSALSAASA